MQTFPISSQVFGIYFWNSVHPSGEVGAVCLVGSTWVLFEVEDPEQVLRCRRG